MHQKRIRLTLAALCLSSLGYAAFAKNTTPPTLPEALPKDVSKAVVTKAAEVSERLLAFEDCEFLVQIYHPKDVKETQLGLCLYPLTIVRGIFSDTTCVGVLIEPETATRHAFYGNKGHWGVEGPCKAERLKKKFLDKEIDTTVNPLTSLRQKQKEGMRLRLLRDKHAVWATFKKRAAPTK